MRHVELAEIANDHMIEILTALPDNCRSGCVRTLLAVAEEAVRLEIPRGEGEGQCEYWMVDGDYLDALIIAIPAEGEIEIAPFDSHDWPESLREALAAAKDSHYA